ALIALVLFASAAARSAPKMKPATNELNSINQKISACYASGRFGEALPLLERAIDIRTAQGAGSDTLAYCYLNYARTANRIGRREEALHALDAAIDLWLKLSAAGRGSGTRPRIGSANVWSSEIERKIKNAWSAPQADKTRKLAVFFVVTQAGDISLIQLDP